MDPAIELEASVLAQQKPMLAAMAQGESEVQRFYNNSVVFLTGGSGFLGKQLIEKLFRSCQISKVYLLLRPKKGKDCHLRIKEILKDPVFDSLKQKKPDFVTKINAIEGNISDIRLGINDSDWKALTDEVHVIFHLAATTRFDETLQTATLINVRGTREVILLGKECKNLKSFVHVSTAYTNATTVLIKQDVKEEFYKPPVSPKYMISMAEHVESQRLIDLTPSLIKDWPNTYTFTKAISEELVRDMSAGLPICIVRPGIVLSSYREPSPGWIDKSCIFGATGFVLGVGLGLLHIVFGNYDTKLGFVPCDYVNNAMIAAARETATNQAKGGDDTRIYSVTSTHKNPVTWRTLSDVLNKDWAKYSSPKAFYYNFATLTSNKCFYLFMVVFLQFIPAYIADFVAFLLGKQRRFAKMAHKVYKVSDVVSYFCVNEWKFIEENSKKLYENLSNQDQAIFNFNMMDINWKEYIFVWCIGVRKYIIKDGLKDTAYAIKKQKILRVLHYIIMSLYIYCIWKLIHLTYYCMKHI